MITFDGDRSKKRKWFANKQLAVIKDIDVPAKAVQWDGFTVKVWQQGDLSGGRITAPMGAVVAISNTDGIYLSAADYWLGGFSTYGHLGSLFWNVPANDTEAVVVNKADEQTMTDAGYITYPFSPAIVLSWFGLVNEAIVTGSVQVANYSTQPCLMPYETSEAFWCTATDIVYVDIDLSGTPDQYKVVYDNSLLFYQAAGNNLGGRMTYSVQTGSAGRNFRIGQQLTATKQVSYCHTNYDTDGLEMICFRNIEFPNEEKIYLSAVIPEGFMPAELRTIILNTTGTRSIHPMGSYSFEIGGVQTLLHVMNVTVSPIVYFSGGAAEDYFDAHVEDEEWKLFYSMTVGETTYLINSDQFMPLLDSLATDVDVYANWSNARRMLEQLAAAIPNNAFSVPYDSIMFHSHAGDIYVWSRTYGTVKFTTTGLFSAAINVPPEVDATVGVRPEITYAGTYDETPLYLCICNRVKEEIDAVYYGSPFGSWTKLPGAPDGYTLVHARPVKVTPTEIHLIGVVKRDVEPVYNFAYLKWIPDSVETWKVLGQLPFTVQSFDNFAVCLYGEGQLARDLAVYQTPPMILPETPVGPYDKYAIGLP